jgi:hypothetical protein
MHIWQESFLFGRIEPIFVFRLSFVFAGRQFVLSIENLSELVAVMTFSFVDLRVLQYRHMCRKNFY